MHPSVISDATPISYGGALPETAGTVVIGGGVIGVCTALYLAQGGHDVVLLEKGRIAGEQSSRNWGFIRQQGRDPDELPIMIEARARWLELARQTNVDFGLRQGGVTFLAREAKRIAGFERWAALGNAAGVDTKVLTASDVAKMFPGMGQPMAGAMHTASDMRAEPALAVPALAGIATRAGARLIEGCAVRMLDITAGRVAGVLTEAGRIGTSSVVLAGGAWSALFLRNHGINLPQLAVRQSVLATTALPEVTPGGAAAKGISFRRRQDGGYTLAAPGTAELYIGPDAFRALPHYLPQLKADPWSQSYLGPAPKGFPDAWRTPRRWSPEDRTPFEVTRVLDPAPNPRHLRRILRNFARLFPGMPEVRLKSAWAGMIDTMPDIVPVVDHAAALPGLVIGTGMSGHGFGIGPGIGRVLAALVTGDVVGHDLSRFRADRFTNGRSGQLGPTF